MFLLKSYSHRWDEYKNEIFTVACLETLESYWCIAT
jgi:hypothetical protein